MKGRARLKDNGSITGVKENSMRTTGKTGKKGRKKRKRQTDKERQ